MTDIITIILDYFEYIDHNLLLKCSMISKDFHIDIFWYKRIFIKKIYDNNICIKCQNNKSSNDFAMCNTCVKLYHTLITKSNAKKLWFLTEHDLRMLNSFVEYIPLFKKYATYYDIYEVKSYAIYKHKPKNLRVLQNSANVNKHNKKNKRLNNIYALNPIFNEGDKLWNICFYDYIENGKESLNKIKRKYEQYKNQYEYKYMMDKFKVMDCKKQNLSKNISN